MREVAFTPTDYCVLLGLYLGDGCIDDLARTQRLRISLDARYPVLNAEVVQLLERCFPANPPGFYKHHDRQLVIVSVHHRHLGCLFPQHGRGKKHERDVSLEPWQLDLVRSAPYALLRGLIASDGCHYVNRTGRYEYFSYSFANHSSEIRTLFTSTCRLVGIECSETGTNVHVRQRASVATMLENVGVKA